MSTGMSARMATMRIRMRRKKHCKPMMDQCRLQRTDLGTSDVDGYECEDGDNADTDEEDDALHADDGLMQNVEH